jgi:hypothetical protein
MANDVCFYGVIFIMFTIGYFLSMFYLSTLRGNIIAKSILPLFAIMFAFMPANNQILCFMESLFSFWFICTWRKTRITIL